MAESPTPTPTPPIPGPIMVVDLCILTQHRILRSRTYWDSTTAPANETQLTAAADAVKAAFNAPLIALLPEVHQFLRTEAWWYGGGGELFFANSTSAPADGDLSSKTEVDDEVTSETEDIMPDDTCLIIQKKCGLRGHSNQGRIFVGGISERVQIAGVVTPQFHGPVKTLAAKLNTNIAVSGSGLTTTLAGRHWNRKTNTMLPITKVYVVKAIGSRMDRRPKALMERL